MNADTATSVPVRHSAPYIWLTALMQVSPSCLGTARGAMLWAALTGFGLSRLNHGYLLPSR